MRVYYLYLEQVAQTFMTGHNRYRLMLNELYTKTDPNEPMTYQIRIGGHLGREWTDWFEGLTIALEDNGDTLITGPVIDQAALFGLLKKVRDLGMTLLSVVGVKPGQAQASDVKQEMNDRIILNLEGTNDSSNWG